MSPVGEVTLRALEAADADAMLRWMRDPEVAENLGLRSAPSRERTEAFLLRARTDASVVARAIVVGGVHVGNVVLDAVDRVVGRARLHIYVGEPAMRGKGVGRKAVALAVALAFDELGLQKVYLTVHAKNARAIASYEAAGFAVEGVHRREFLLGGELVDELYMGILAPAKGAP